MSHRSIRMNIRRSKTCLPFPSLLPRRQPQRHPPCSAYGIPDDHSTHAYHFLPHHLLEHRRPRPQLPPSPRLWTPRAFPVPVSTCIPCPAQSGKRTLSHTTLHSTPLHSITSDTTCAWQGTGGEGRGERERCGDVRKREKERDRGGSHEEGSGKRVWEAGLRGRDGRGPGRLVMSSRVESSQVKSCAVLSCPVLSRLVLSRRVWRLNEDKGAGAPSRDDGDWMRQ